MVFVWKFPKKSVVFVRKFPKKSVVFVRKFAKKSVVFACKFAEKSVVNAKIYTKKRQLETFRFRQPLLLFLHLNAMLRVRGMGKMPIPPIFLLLKAERFAFLLFYF